MHAFSVTLLVFACAFGGALAGMLLRRMLPDHHLTTESKDTVKLGIGLVGTMTALLLSLLVASTKSGYDTRRAEITEMAAKIALLDRTLANYGTETEPARGVLRTAVASAMNSIWPPAHPRQESTAPSNLTEAVLVAIEELQPVDDRQRALKSRAIDLATAIGLTRWMLFEQSGSSISAPLLLLTIVWLTIIFASFGLFAPPNATVVCTLLLCALSVGGSMFLVLELDQPFSGVIRVSDAPFRTTLDIMGK